MRRFKSPETVAAHAALLKARRIAKQRTLEPQLITDRRFMTRPQREAHAKGIEIWR